jgi:hypothetical protein
LNPDDKGRATLVSVINTPLGFFALSLLIVEGFIGIILVGSGLNKTGTTGVNNNLTGNQKFAGMLLGIFLFVLVVVMVTILVWFKPTHLTFSERSHLEHEKMYGDQSTPKSETSLKKEEKIEPNQASEAVLEENKEGK